MGDDLFDMHRSILDQVDRLFHILGISATGADNMGHIIVHIKEVDRCMKITIQRTGKEIQAAILGKHSTCLCHHIRIGSHDKHIIKTADLFRQESTQLLCILRNITCIHVMQGDTVFRRLLHRVEPTN